jgi:hypothetical protein
MGNPLHQGLWRKEIWKEMFVEAYLELVRILFTEPQ